MVAPAARPARAPAHPGVDRRHHAASRSAHTTADGEFEVDLVAFEALVAPSPARADRTTRPRGCPCPAISTSSRRSTSCSTPTPRCRPRWSPRPRPRSASSLAAAEAVVAPSPARAEPHDAAAWLPLPSVDDLPLVPELAGDPRSDTGAAGAGARPRRRRLASLAPLARALFVILLVVATVMSGVWVVRRLTAPGGSSVTLVVDGDRVQFRTGVGTVGALLAAQHVHLASGDTVTPAPDASLSDGMHVAVARSFPVSVDLDGKVRTVRTTATSAAALGQQLHVGKLVAVRGDPGRLESGSAVQFRTRHGGRLEIDGQTVAFDSPSLTVAELLESYDVTLVGDDYVAPRAHRPPRRRHDRHRGPGRRDDDVVHRGLRVRHGAAARPRPPDRPDP